MLIPVKYIVKFFTAFISWLLSWWYTFKNDMSELDEDCILHDSAIWTAKCDKIAEYTVPLTWEGILLSARIFGFWRTNKNTKS